jgi:hypothetical protein
MLRRQGELAALSGVVNNGGMIVTPTYLDQFHQFALGKMSAGEAKSLTQLAAEWEMQQRDAITEADLRECMADMEAGIGQPLRKVDAQLRAKHGFQPRKTP